MADPLSISASVIALLQLTGTVIHYLQDAAGASKDRAAILLEVSSVQGVLVSLRDLLERDDVAGELADSRNLMVKSLTVGGGPLDQFKATLERLASKLAPADGNFKKLRRSAIWPFQKEEIRELLGLIERQKTLFSLALLMDNVELSQAIRNDLDDKINTVAKGVSELQIVQKDEKTSEILAWLSPLEFRSQQSDFIHRRQEGTGTWLLESPEFQNWMKESAKTLYCPGMPGAGKTILSATIIDHLLSIFRGNEKVGVAYIFCNYWREQEQTPANLFSSLLEQLLQQRNSISENVKQIFECHRRGSRPAFNEIFSLLQQEAGKFSRVFFVLDGLDEYSDADQKRELLISKLLELQACSNTNLLATSRFYPTIMKQFQDSVQMEIRAHASDVERYLRGHMGRLAVQPPEALQRDILNAIVQAVDGMFLLAQLHMDSLKVKTSPRAIKKSLNNLKNAGKDLNPLDTAYNDAVSRISTQQVDIKKLAVQTLSWVTYAKRPLTVDELRHALSVLALLPDDLDDPNEPEDLYWDEDCLPDMELAISACAGLVTIDEEGGIVRLVHYTTQTYFEHNLLKHFPDAKVNTAEYCLTYLLFDNFFHPCVDVDAFYTQESKFKFLKYAANHWGDHVRGHTEQKIQDLIYAFLTDENKLENAALVHFYPHLKYCGLPATKISAVHYCGYFDLDGFMARLIKGGMAADTRDCLGRTALSWSAQQGCEASARFLLARHDVDVNSRDDISETPLRYAIDGGGHVKIIRLLLERADINVNLGDHADYTPLHTAVILGEEVVISLLLERADVNVNLKDCTGLIALHYAIINHKGESVKFLLERTDLNVNLRDSNDCTFLMYAVFHGIEEIARLLLERDDLNMNIKDNDGETALDYAVSMGNKKIIQMLESRGAL